MSEAHAVARLYDVLGYVIRMTPRSNPQEIGSLSYNASSFSVKIDGRWYELSLASKDPR